MNGEFRIGPWLVQPRLNLLSQDGTAVHLEPKVMEVLVCLAQRYGEPVPREELIQTVWPDTFVTDDVLKRCVSELRRVFEDDAREPRVIETIPKRGYRLLVAVEKIGASSPNHVPPPPPLDNFTLHEQQEAKVRLGVRITALLLPISAAFSVLVVFVAAAYVLGRKGSVLAPPSFHRLTFERGIIYSARFAPDGQVVYDASWDNRPIRIFTTHAGILQPMQLDFSSAHLLDVSQDCELALTLNGYPESSPVFLRGTLARAPTAGGSPRHLLEDVRWADFDSRGELAIVHHLNGRSRLEYPIGKVLYENAGWISHIRFSPKNDRIAFIDHPVWSDDRGSIAAVDRRSGEVKTLSSGWESAMGLAWSKSGDEIWFTAAKSGERRDLFAVDLRGRQRALLQVPGGITLQDISPGGRALLTADNERVGTMVLTSAGERDLSWLDLTYPAAISEDGNRVLLEEQSALAGPDYWVGLRNIDGSPPVRLGAGWGGGFSPDGKWTATDVNSAPESTFVLPIGVGERRELKHPGIKTYGYGVLFMPDGKSVVFSGIESGHLPRSYIQNIQGGPARPITPEGLLGVFASPDGRYLVGKKQDESSVIYDIQHGESRVIPGIKWQLLPAGWSLDSRYLYLYTRSVPPSKVWRLDMAAGRETLVKQLSPTDPAGILEIYKVKLTPDEKTFAYSYDRYLSELYIVDGLR